MTVIAGTDSGETLAGTDGDDEISALGGDDWITVSQGHDTVDGGSGIDTLWTELTTLPWLPSGARTYTVTADHLSDGSGALDTGFSNVERIDIFDTSGFALTLAAGGFTGQLTFWSGAGNDNLAGGSSSDSITGGGGDDLIVGGRGEDSLGGGTGQDTIFGGIGNDVIDGGEGFDTVRGGDGDDRLFGTGFEADWLMGGRGDDQLIAQGGVWHLYGGDDPQAGWPGGWNVQFGGEDLSGEDDGNDYISLYNGHISTIDGGSGDDRIDVLGGSEILVAGGTGDDQIYSSATELIAIDGGAGHDNIRYTGGNSTAAANPVLIGGTGDDTVYYNQFTEGSPDDATLIGGEGFDRLETVTWRGASHVTIDAGDQADLVQIVRHVTDHDIALGTGSDLLVVSAEFHLAYTAGVEIVVSDFTPGDGGDTLNLVTYLARQGSGWNHDENPFAAGFLRLEQRGGDTVVQVDHDGAAATLGFADVVVLQGVSAAALTERNLGGFSQTGVSSGGTTVEGAATPDQVGGTGSDDILRGHDGNDALFGGLGDDMLEGGAGNDILDGEFGDDTVHGGAGDDAIWDRFAGSDRVYGEDGNDSIFVDRQWFGLEDEVLVLDGGAGNDQLVFMGKPNHDQATLIGGTGNDSISVYLGRNVTVDAGDGNDSVSWNIAGADLVISLGAGADALDPYMMVGSAAPQGVVTITDFDGGDGGDRFYLWGVVQGLAPGWDDTSNPFAGNFMRLVRDGADILLAFNEDGEGADYQVLTRLMGVDAAELTALNFGYDFGAVVVAGSGEAETLVGTAIEEELLGLGGSDHISALGGNDILDGGLGNDTLVGGDGFDTAVFPGNRAGYAWTVSTGQTAIAGPDGNDTLSGIERMEFADAAYELSTGYAPATLALAGFGAGPASGGWSDSDLNPRALTDLNGDGRLDIAGFGEGGVYVSLAAAGGGFAAPFLASSGFGSSAGSGNWTSQAATPRALADVNGDGVADLVGFGAAGVYASLGAGDGTFGAAYLATVGFGSSAASGGWSDSDANPRVLADLDGDGRADILGFGAGGTYAALAAADGTFGAASRASPGFGSGAESGGWASDATTPRVLADINGDGNADIVGFASAGVYASLGNGDGSFAAPFLATIGFGSSAGSGGWSDGDAMPRLVADLNGDGRADILGFGAGGTYVALAEADGRFAAPFLAHAGFGSSAGSGGWASQTAMPRMLADLNGDGVEDLVGFGAGGIYAALGDGDGAFGGAFLAYTGFGSSAGSGGWGDGDLHPRLLADLNGDGIADVLGFGDSGVVTASSVSDWVLA